MPYIKAERRKDFKDGLDALPIPDNAGELNYVFTMIAIKYFRFKPNGGNYQAINDVAGAFHGAADEFTRRITASYETQKAEQNGDVY